MNKNKRYVFLTAEEIVAKLILVKKEYDFTFDCREDVEARTEPSAWHGVKLMNLFDGGLPDCLAIGYYGGGNTRVFNLEYDEEGNSIDTTEELRELMIKYLNSYFEEESCTEVCVEIV